MKKRLLFLPIILLALIIGNYFFKTSAQGSPAPECQCQYPNGGGHGVLKPIDPPVDGSRYTCVVKTCYIRVGGGEFESEEGGNY